MSDRVPDWVYMADVPPTDEEPHVHEWEWCHTCDNGDARCAKCPAHQVVPHDDDRGLWLGWVLLLAAVVIGILIGRLTAG